ncbi:MAG: hypothetical protein Q8K75_11350 [Chlamydiales bacterium]|nr:hypothetical protein [Chlamydiales bacterium]
MKSVRQQVLALELLKRLGEQQQRIFSIDSILPLSQEVGLSPKELSLALNTLQEEGWIAVIRKGNYAITSPIAQAETAHSFEIAMELVTPAAISHWSALQHHELITHPAPYIYVLTETTPSMPRYRRKDVSLPPKVYPVGKLLYHFVQIKPERFFGTEKVLIGPSTFYITNLERSLWDAVALPHYCGGWASVEAAFFVARDRIDTRKLIFYALKGDAATAKRIGWLLEYQGKSVDELKPLLDLPIKGYRLLDPSSPAQGPFNSRWMVRINTLTA